MMEEGITRDKLAEEESVREEVDDKGNKWKKVYLVGEHFSKTGWNNMRSSVSR